MRHPIVALVVAPILLAIVDVRSAAACSCVQPQGCTVDDAPVLFVGRVLDVSTSRDRVVARFQVERAAKGVYTRQVIAVQAARTNSTCDMGFAAGERWLIAARASGSGAATGTADRQDAPWSTGACSGSRFLRDGDAGPMFLARGGITGTLERFDAAGSGPTPWLAGVRVWIEGAAGIIETRTDKDGRFLFRDVPLRPARPLHFDVGPRLRVADTLVAPWTPDVCTPLRIVAQPAG
jgi:hypothetical protein